MAKENQQTQLELLRQMAEGMQPDPPQVDDPYMAAAMRKQGVMTPLVDLAPSAPPTPLGDEMLTDINARGLEMDMRDSGAARMLAQQAMPMGVKDLMPQLQSISPALGPTPPPGALPEMTPLQPPSGRALTPEEKLEMMRQRR